MPRLKSLVTALLLASTILASAAQAAQTSPLRHQAETPRGTEADRTLALLDRAEAHLREQGGKAMASFSRAGEFVDEDLYVYVIDMRGHFLASGGSSITLIGRNVFDLTDSDGRHFIREILDGARLQPSGRVEYRWSNPTRGRNEPKIATYRRVGDNVLVVGYYAPNASFEQAKSLVWRAVHELKVNGQDAFSRFSSLNGGYIQDDLYLFAININDGVVRVHGGQPRQVGRKAEEIADANGKHFLKDMIAIAKRNGEGEISYTFRNPLTLKNEFKRSFFVRVGDDIVGAGAYLPYTK